jgi:hypothetical protein
MAVMMSYVAGAVFVVAVGFWVSALVHSIWLLWHLAPEMSLGRVLFQGYRFYLRDTFAPSGHAIHRRFVLSGVGFFLSIVVGIAVALLATPAS